MIQYFLFETRFGDWLCALVERTTGQVIVVSENGRGLVRLPLREVEGILDGFVPVPSHEIESA